MEKDKNNGESAWRLRSGTVGKKLTRSGIAETSGKRKGTEGKKSTKSMREEPARQRTRGRKGSAARGIVIVEGLPVGRRVDPDKTAKVVTDIVLIRNSGQAPHRNRDRVENGSPQHPHRNISRRESW